MPSAALLAALSPNVLSMSLPTPTIAGIERLCAMSVYSDASYHYMRIPRVVVTRNSVSSLSANDIADLSRNVVRDTRNRAPEETVNTALRVSFGNREHLCESLLVKWSIIPSAALSAALLPAV